MGGGVRRLGPISYGEEKTVGSSLLRYCISSVYIQIPELFHMKPEQKAISTMRVIDLILFPILSKSAHADFKQA